MNLEGSLDAFGLRDLFLLLAGTAKSGVLRLTHDGEAGTTRGVVRFSGGEVSGASADISRLALARRLVGIGAVDDTALAAAVGVATAGGPGVVRGLLEAGALDPAVLREAATEQTVDAVCELLRWHTGEFSFDLDATDGDDVGVRLPVAEVVSLADARDTAWTEVAAVIPSPDAVLSLPVTLPEDPVLTRDEWSLVALVDGRRTVEDLVLITGAGRFRVASMLAALVGRGLVQVGAGARDDHAGAVQRRLAVLARAEAADAVPAARGDQPRPAAAVRQEPRVPETRAPETRAPETRTPASGTPVRTEVVPERPEPFLPARRPEHAEPMPERPAARTASDPGRAAPPRPPAAPLRSGAPSSRGSAAVAPAGDALVERDPSVNRSLLLRLIAGVRGL